MYTHHIYTHLYQISHTYIICRWATYGSAALWLTRRCRIHKTSADALVKGRKCQVQGVLPFNLSLSLSPPPSPSLPSLSPFTPSLTTPCLLSSLCSFPACNIFHTVHISFKACIHQSTRIYVYVCMYVWGLFLAEEASREKSGPPLMQ